MADKQILWTINVDSEVAQKAIVDYQVELDKLKVKKKEVEAQNKKGELSEEEYAKAILDTNKQIKSNTEAQKKLIEVQNVNKGSVKELSLSLKEAKKQLEDIGDAYEIAADGSLVASEAYKEQAERVANLEDALKQLKGSKSFEDKIKEVQFFGVSLGDAESKLKSFIDGGLGGAVKGLVSFGKALLTSPLGIFAVVIGTVITALSRSQKAMEFFRKATAGLGEVLDILLKPLDLVADGIIALGESAAKVFSFISNFFSESDDERTRSAYELEAALIDIEKAEKKIEVQRKQSLATQEKLKTLRDDEGKGTAARLKANQELGREIEKSFGKEIDLQEQKLKVLEEQLANEKNTKDQKEIQEKIDEQLLKMAETKEELEGKRVEQITNQNSLLREQIEIAANISDLTLKLAIAQGKINADSKEALDTQIANIDKRLKAQLLSVEKGTDVEKQFVLEAEVEKAELIKSFNEKNAENYKAYTEKVKANAEKLNEELKLINEASLQTEVTRLENLANIENEANAKQLEAFKNGQIQKVEFQNASNQALIDARKKLIDFEASEELKEVQRSTKNKELIEVRKKQIQQQANLDKLALDSDFNTRSLALEAERIAAEFQLKDNARLEEARRNIAFFENEISQRKREGQATTELERQLQAERFKQQLEQLKVDLEQKRITEAEFASLERTAFEQNETAKREFAIAEKQKEIEAQQNLENARLSIAQSVSEGLTAIAGENKAVKAAAFAFEQTAAIAEAGLSLQRQLASQNEAGAKLDAVIPGSGVAYRVAAIASTVARMIGIIAKIKSFKFAEGGYTGEGFGAPDETGFKIAGFVHENEYVMPKWLLQTNKGFDLMQQAEGLRLQGRGYAQGGGVGFDASRFASNNFETTKYLVDAISNLKIYTDIQEFRSVANRVQTVENRANL